MIGIRLSRLVDLVKAERRIREKRVDSLDHPQLTGLQVQALYFGLQLQALPLLVLVGSTLQETVLQVIFLLDIMLLELLHQRTDNLISH
jgi:hypothetical protein